MALGNCPECQAAVSSSAANCPHCGFKLRSSGFVRALKWIVGIPVAAFVAMMVAGFFLKDDGRVSESERKECAAAMMSSIGSSTRNYTDKLAYEKVVREKCSGITIDGKPVVP